MQEAPWPKFSHNIDKYSFTPTDSSAHINRDVVDATSPKSKRQRSSQDMFNQTDDSTSRNYQSQPMPQVYHVQEAPAVEPHFEARNGFCFSQPAMMDDLILCTQLNSTQTASQNLFQKLVRRMTRFFVSTNFDDSIKRLTATIEKLAYTWRVHDGGMVSQALIIGNFTMIFQMYPLIYDDVWPTPINCFHFLPPDHHINHWSSKTAACVQGKRCPNGRQDIAGLSVVERMRSGVQEAFH